jgi:dTDP-4-amino-4,6-dideoxygalactose transaminase
VEGESSYHIFHVLFERDVDRARVIERLKERGIQSSIHYPSIGEFTAYRGIRGEAPIADDISRRELTLPFFPTMTEDDVAVACSSITEALR